MLFSTCKPGKRLRAASQEAVWGLIFLVPYIVLFLALVIYPVAYGLVLGTNPKSYLRLWSDPVFLRTIVNTVVFLGLAVNLKLFLALLLSGFFVHEQRWIRWLSVIFILPWAIPSIPPSCPSAGCLMRNGEWSIH